MANRQKRVIVVVMQRGEANHAKDPLQLQPIAFC
jgi:hypothetical protein